MGCYLARDVLRHASSVPYLARRGNANPLRVKAAPAPVIDADPHFAATIVVLLGGVARMVGLEPSVEWATRGNKGGGVFE